jgi:hypothetical protein
MRTWCLMKCPQGMIFCFCFVVVDKCIHMDSLISFLLS